MKRKILFITGTRADFGKLKPLMLKIERSPDFECLIFATGMHTLSKYGLTYDEIRKTGFKNIFAFINQDESVRNSMDIILSNTIEGISRYIHEQCPDLIVVHGDRVETLAGAIVGALNNILVAHIEGGELSGTIDELLRHATTKMAHLHFVSNNEAKKRLIQMGEFESSVYVIGSPDIDIMLSKSLPSLTQVKRRYGINFDTYGIFVYHPVTTDIPDLETKINNIIDAINRTKLNFIVLYPNNDFGSDIILKALNRLNGNPKFRIFPSVRFEYFLVLLKNARVIVGNSSSGIREAPVYGIPTVNIGTRQNNRFLTSSIINVGEDAGKIEYILNKLPEHFKSCYHFGEGKSAEQFLKILKSKKIWNTPCQKQFQEISLKNRYEN
jgi:UDP-N-acetylglucosamine 2-epimerase (hydrolysing)